MLDGHVIHSARGPGFKPCLCQIILWTIGEKFIKSCGVQLYYSAEFRWNPLDSSGITGLQRNPVGITGLQWIPVGITGFHWIPGSPIGIGGGV